jgi:hypothetical protein
MVILVGAVSAEVVADEDEAKAVVPPSAYNFIVPLDLVLVKKTICALPLLYPPS